MSYKIVPNPAYPRFAPLFGWRAWLNRWLRIPFRRARYVYIHENGRLECHPESVPALRRYLEANRLPFVQEPAVLQTVTDKK